MRMGKSTSKTKYYVAILLLIFLLNPRGEQSFAKEVDVEEVGSPSFDVAVDERMIDVKDGLELSNFDACNKFMESFLVETTGKLLDSKYYYSKKFGYVMRSELSSITVKKETPVYSKVICWVSEDKKV